MLPWTSHVCCPSSHWTWQRDQWWSNNSFVVPEHQIGFSIVPCPQSWQSSVNDGSLTRLNTIVHKLQDARPLSKKNRRFNHQPTTTKQLKTYCLFRFLEFPSSWMIRIRTIADAIVYMVGRWLLAVFLWVCWWRISMWALPSHYVSFRGKPSWFTYFKTGLKF